MPMKDLSNLPALLQGIPHELISEHHMRAAGAPGAIARLQRFPKLGDVVDIADLIRNR